MKLNCIRFVRSGLTGEKLKGLGQEEFLTGQKDSEGNKRWALLNQSWEIQKPHERENQKWRGEKPGSTWG